MRIHLHKVVAITALACALLMVTACSENLFLGAASDIPNSNSNLKIETPNAPDPEEISPPAVEPVYKSSPLSWDSASYPERAKWSSFLQEIILTKWTSLLQGADDIESFCPRFYRLDNYQRANAWAAIFAGVAKYESAYKPTMRFHESTMGTDPITNQAVYSEGLLQLSYQDIRPYPFCDFDWGTDKKLSVTDSRKTIFDPKKNLDCGVGIMSRQLARSGRVTVSKSVYWSTLKLNGRYSKISAIQAIVKKQPYCL